MSDLENLNLKAPESSDLENLNLKVAESAAREAQRINEEAEAKRIAFREEALKKSAEYLAKGRFVEAIFWKNRAYQP